MKVLGIVLLIAGGVHLVNGVMSEAGYLMQKDLKFPTKLDPLSYVDPLDTVAVPWGTIASSLVVMAVGFYGFRNY